MTTRSPASLPEAARSAAATGSEHGPIMYGLCEQGFTD
jgi:hypothetical protein